MPEETILVVDDEIANLQKLRRTFINRYPVLAASSGNEALELVNKNADIAVIVADQRMPNMTGIEFLRQTLEPLPQAIRIILTGFTDTEVLMDAINSCKVYRYMLKPWDPQDLLMTVERGLEAYRLVKENEQFRKELVRRERLARELEIASEIQRYILPPFCPELPGYEMGIEYHPAREVGGDLYDFYLDSGILQLAVGDVSGKSIPAALYGAVFSGQLQPVFSRSMGPEEALAALNSSLVGRYRASNYIAVSFCRIDLQEGSLLLANAGMPFPYLVRGNNVSRLELPGVPLGLMEDMTYDCLKAELAPGDTLILASDGTADALNREKEFYSEKRFVESIRRHASKCVSEQIKSVYSEITEFVGSAEINDDITIVALRRLPSLEDDAASAKSEQQKGLHRF